MNRNNVKQWLTLRGISKRYPVFSLIPYKKSYTEALKEIDLSLNEGQVTCILGPNGAGKTTMLKIIADLVLPDGGVIEHKMNKHPRVGFVTPNERSFYWRLSGRENLRFFAALSRIKGKQLNERVEAVIKETGLSDFAATPYRLYSSGMKQRLNIARALLPEPELILLDEPTAHLDPLAKAEFWRFIREHLLRARKSTVLLATHDLEEATVLSDQMAILNKGRIVAAGTITELQERMSEARRIVLTYESAHDTEPLKAAAEAAGAERREEDGYISVFAQDEAAVREMVLTLAEAGNIPYSLVRENASLLSIIAHYSEDVRQEIQP